MLNWRLEEREYVSNKVDEYLKKIPSLSRIFMSDKQLNKNIKLYNCDIFDTQSIKLTQLT